MIRSSWFTFMMIIALFDNTSLYSEDSEIVWQFVDIEGEVHKPFEDLSTCGIVLVFVSTSCPISNSYQPLLHQLAKKHQKNGIKFFQVHPHSGTSVEEAREHASDYKIESPVLIDAEQLLAKRVKATTTPEAFVFLRDRQTPIYHGRIDNLYAGFGKKRKVVTSNDLADVLNRVVARDRLIPSKTKPIGCLIAF